MINKRFVTTIAMLVAGGMIATPARASLVVDIGGTVLGGVYTPGTVYVDNGVEDANPAVGIIDLGAFLNSVVSNFVVTGFASTSGNTGGLPAFASLTLNANAILRPAATLPFIVDIVISDSGFTVPLGPLTLEQTSNLLSAPRGLAADAVAVGYLGASNTVFDVSQPTADATSFLLGGIGTNTVGDGIISAGAPYSLTTYIHTRITARGTDPVESIQINSDLSAAPNVPEPASVLLLGAGMLGLGILFRKHHKEN